MDIEVDIMRRIMIRASEMGARLFRNNTGTGWQGDIQWMKDGSILIRNPRPLHAGLAKGSSDLIGWVPMVVTADMVGKTIAVFAAIEVKRPGEKPTTEQAKFLSVVKRCGAIGSVATGDGQLDDMLRGDPTVATTS